MTVLFIDPPPIYVHSAQSRFVFGRSSFLENYERRDLAVRIDANLRLLKLRVGELKSRWDISVMMYLWRRDFARDFVVQDYSWDLMHGGNFVL